MDRIGICFLDRPSVQEQVAFTRLAESKGFESVWVCESRLVRDAISVLGAMATCTKKIKLCTGVINNWTRGPALTAMTFATLHEMSRGRAVLGIGSYWDPLAWKQGIERRKPLKAMREFVDVFRRLLGMESVTFEGDIVKVRDIRLDLGHGISRSSKKIPIYIGATGFKMMELAGEIANGVLLNAFVSAKYTRAAVQHIKRGAQNVGRNLRAIDRPQLLACSMLPDGDKARDLSRYLVTLYLGQQPHIMKASGINDQFIADINSALGGWPPKRGGVDSAMKLVDDSIVDMLTISGTPTECKKMVREYLTAGASYPVLLPVSENIREIINVFAR